MVAAIGARVVAASAAATAAIARLAVVRLAAAVASVAGDSVAPIVRAAGTRGAVSAVDFGAATGIAAAVILPVALVAAIVVGSAVRPAIVVPVVTMRGEYNAARCSATTHADLALSASRRNGAIAATACVTPAGNVRRISEYAATDRRLD